MAKKEKLKHFSDMSEDEAREFLENLRWPNGVICPHCEHNVAHKLTAKEGTKTHVRDGVYMCAKCRKQFSVKVGTIFESSHIPLRKWVMAFYLMNTSKKGISAHQLHRMLGVTYKTAWFMCHRIRESSGNGQQITPEIRGAANSGWFDLLMLRTRFPKFGTYNFEIVVGGEVVHTIPLPVNQIQ